MSQLIRRYGGFCVTISNSMKYGRLSVESFGPSGWFSLWRFKIGHAALHDRCYKLAE